MAVTYQEFQKIMLTYESLDKNNRMVFDLRFSEMPMMYDQTLGLVSGNGLLDHSLKITMDSFNRHVEQLNESDEDNPFDSDDQTPIFHLYQMIIKTEDGFDIDEVLLNLKKECEKHSSARKLQERYDAESKEAKKAVKKLDSISDSNSVKTVIPSEDNPKISKERVTKQAKLQMDFYNFFVDYDQDVKAIRDARVWTALLKENKTFQGSVAWMEYLREELRSIFSPKNKAEASVSHILEAVDNLNYLSQDLPRKVNIKDIPNIYDTLRTVFQFRKYTENEKGNELLSALQKYHAQRNAECFEKPSNIKKLRELSNHIFDYEHLRNGEEFDRICHCLHIILDSFEHNLYIDKENYLVELDSLQKTLNAYQSLLATKDSLKEKESSILDNVTALQTFLPKITPKVISPKEKVQAKKAEKDALKAQKQAEKDAVKAKKQAEKENAKETARKEKELKKQEKIKKKQQYVADAEITDETELVEDEPFKEDVDSNNTEITINEVLDKEVASNSVEPIQNKDTSQMAEGPVMDYDDSVDTNDTSFTQEHISPSEENTKEPVHHKKSHLILYIGIAAIILVVGTFVFGKDILLPNFDSFGSLFSSKEVEEEVIVEPEPEKVSIYENFLQLNVGDTAQLHASGADSYTYVSDNPSVVTVDSNGVITAISAGDDGIASATITATGPQGTQACCSITTIGTPDYSKFTIATEYGTTLPQVEDGSFQLALATGERVQLFVQGTEQSVEWSSSNPEFVSVSLDGTVEKRSDAHGMATISAVCGNVTLTIQVTHILVPLN